MDAEKPFDPTPARLARARREGDVPQSQALGVVASLAGASLTLFALLNALASASRLALEDAARRQVSAATYLTFGTCAVAVLCGAIAGALIASYGQSGRFSARFPAPKFSKLNPAGGLKRMLSRDAFVAGLRAVLVAFAVAAAAYGPLAAAFVAGIGSTAPGETGALALRAIGQILFAAIAVAAMFSIADVMLERAKWRRRLRMSFDELKREHKQSEGDPAVRGKRRRAHRALARGSIARLKEAAFVVCNPTHVAVALAYRPPDIVVPQILVRAIDDGAREVRRRARQLGIPIVENAWLARTLLAATEAGDYIPVTVYGVVAAIVAQLQREKTPA
jgi:flagellar biosynthesis protein FlhB